MSRGPLRIGVIGAGPMGRLHARAIARRRTRQGDCELRCVVDRHPQRSETVAREFDARPATDWRDEVGSLDAAVVAVPTHAHAALADALLEAGLDLLVEKPLTLSSEEARPIVERAAADDRVLQVGLSEWYNPGWREAVRRVGAIRSIEVERLHPRSERGLDMDVVQDFMVHDLDWITRWIGEPVARVTARGRKVGRARWDEAEAELFFESGVLARLRSSRVADARVRQVRVEGASAAVKADLLSGIVESTGRAEASPARAAEDEEPLDRQLADFVLACRTRKAPESDGAIGLAAVLLVERVQQAIDAEAAVAGPRGGPGS